MRQKLRFTCAALAFAIGFLLAAGAGPVLMAQRPASPGVVTPDDPIWGGAQEPQEPQPQEPAAEPAAADAAAAARGRGAGGGAQPRPYAQVITSEARTDEGIFKVHRIREQLFYEIPKAELGKDFLWVSQIKRASVGAALTGAPAGNLVVRWQLLGNRVLLRLVDYSIVADPSTPIARAVADSNNPAIVRAFNVAAFSPSGDPVIEVTQLFLTEVPELSVRGRIGARGFDQSRTFIEKAVSYPENINVEITRPTPPARTPDAGPTRQPAAAACAAAARRW